jgi:hypothetical protein
MRPLWPTTNMARFRSSSRSPTASRCQRTAFRACVKWWVARTTRCPGCEAARGCSIEPAHRHAHRSPMAVVPAGTRRLIARVRREFLRESRKLREKEALSLPGRAFRDFLRPASPRVEHPGLCSDAPCRGSKSDSGAAARSLPTRDVNPRFRETDLGRISFLWLNGESDFFSRLGARCALGPSAGACAGQMRGRADPSPPGPLPQGARGGRVGRDALW